MQFKLRAARNYCGGLEFTVSMAQLCRFHFHIFACRMNMYEHVMNFVFVCSSAPETHAEAMINAVKQGNQPSCRNKSVATLNCVASAYL
jgi:hypothetical protein